MRRSSMDVLPLLCCACALLLSSCVTTDELYAEYDANECKVYIERPAMANLLEQNTTQAQSYVWQPVVFFDYNSASLTDDTIQRLYTTLEVVKQYPGAILALQGFTDHHGSTQYNRTLATRRVNVVSQWLENNGVNTKRLSLRIMGEGLESFNTDDDISRANNRRVELILLDKQGVPLEHTIDARNEDAMSDD